MTRPQKFFMRFKRVPQCKYHRVNSIILGSVASIPDQCTYGSCVDFQAYVKRESVQTPYLGTLSLGHFPCYCILGLFMFGSMTPLRLGANSTSSGRALREHLRAERGVRNAHVKQSTKERYFSTCK